MILRCERWEVRLLPAARVWQKGQEWVAEPIFDEHQGYALLGRREPKEEDAK